MAPVGAPDPRALIEEVTKRFQGWVPIDEWGPVCAGCGGEEFRIDGYCSCECRDFHSDDDVQHLADALRVALARAEDPHVTVCGGDHAVTHLTSEGCPYCRVEAAKARIEKLEEALREIAETEGLTLSDGYDAWGRCRDLARAALTEGEE